MKELIIGLFARAFANLYFAGFVATASAAEPSHIADYIRYEVKVIKMAPGTPDDGVNMDQVVKVQEEYLELLIR